MGIVNEENGFGRSDACDDCRFGFRGGSAFESRQGAAAGAVRSLGISPSAARS